MQSRMAVLAHYLNGDFIPWYFTCCQATSWYIQLVWVAEGNFRIQFRLSLKVVGIAAYKVFTWKRTRQLDFSIKVPFCKQALLVPLLFSLSQLATILITTVNTPFTKWTTLQMFRIHPKCQTPLHVRSFSCFIALPCSWEVSAADREKNFQIAFDRPAGRLCR